MIIQKYAAACIIALTSAALSAGETPKKPGGVSVYAFEAFQDLDADLESPVHSLAVSPLLLGVSEVKAQEEKREEHKEGFIMHSATQSDSTSSVDSVRLRNFFTRAVFTIESPTARAEFANPMTAFAYMQSTSPKGSK